MHACVHVCNNNFLKNTMTLEQGFEGSKGISHMTIVVKSMARRGERMSKGFGNSKEWEKERATWCQEVGDDVKVTGRPAPCRMLLAWQTLDIT